LQHFQTQPRERVLIFGGVAAERLAIQCDALWITTHNFGRAAAIIAKWQQTNILFIDDVVRNYCLSMFKADRVIVLNQHQETMAWAQRYRKKKGTVEQLLTLGTLDMEETDDYIMD
jgi:hypothetical protein